MVKKGDLETNENIETTGGENRPAVKRAPAVPKRGSRKAARAEEEDPEVKIETAISSAEQYIIGNGKKLLSILVVVLLAVGIFLSVKYVYLPNRSEKAGEMMYVAQQRFEEEDYHAALNGDDFNAGFLEVIGKYGSTPQGNIARHYAGVCYMQEGDMDSALEYLAKFKVVKGATGNIITAQNYGLQGDIHSQKGDWERAAHFYNKAVDAGDNSFTSPHYLRKLALVYDKLGRGDDAVKALERIMDEYPSSIEGRDVQKYIGAQEQK